MRSRVEGREDKVRTDSNFKLGRGVEIEVGEIEVDRGRGERRTAMD